MQLTDLFSMPLCVQYVRKFSYPFYVLMTLTQGRSAKLQTKLLQHQSFFKFFFQTSINRTLPLNMLRSMRCWFQLGGATVSKYIMRFKVYKCSHLKAVVELKLKIIVVCKFRNTSWFTTTHQHCSLDP